MDDLANGASNAPSESVTAPIETAAPSIGEAIDKAFATVDKPAEPVEARSDDRPRDEHGRFAPKAGETQKPVEQAKPAEAPPVEQTTPVNAQITPPSRFSKAAQEAYAQTPEVVRQEVERALNEMSAGIQRYQQEFQEIRPFAEQARAQGQSLGQVLTLYTNMERLIASDPVKGILEVCKQGKFDPVKLGQALAGQQPTGGDSPEVAALKNEIAELKNQFGGFTQEQVRTRTETEVAAFAEKHPHFDLVADDIAEMLRTGFAKDLTDAYAKAIRLNPEAAKAIADEQAAAQAAPAQPPADPPHKQKANLQITGSPQHGSNPDTRKPAGSRREALDSAFASVGIT